MISMVDNNELLHFLNVKTTKSCFFCGLNKKLGLKYFPIESIFRFCREQEPILDEHQPLAKEAISCYEICKLLPNSEDIYTQFLNLGLNREQIDILISNEPKSGIPCCWKDCEHANAMNKFYLEHYQPQKLVTKCFIIDDMPFDLGYMKYDPEQYDAMLELKKTIVVEKFVSNNIIPSFDAISCDVYASPFKYFRQRCRLSIRHNSDETISYMMWEEDGTPRYEVLHLPIVSIYINLILPILRQSINDSIILRNSLSGVHFLTSSTGNVIIILLYEVKLTQEWEIEALNVKHFLETTFSKDIQSVQVVGRGHKSKCILHLDYIREVFLLEDGRELHCNMVLDGFSNPNAAVNIQSLNFLCSVIRNIPGLGACKDDKDRFDLLEMYCGMGNHTVALSKYAHRVVAVELNKHLCKAAQENLALNGITNATILTGDSQDFAARVLRRKRYTSKTGEEFSFGAVLVDPPRCGLDIKTLEMVANYPHILYISCNPDALCRDLIRLCETHEIRRFAVFDHFPYTPHLESGVYLVRKADLE